MLTDMPVALMSLYADSYGSDNAYRHDSGNADNAYRHDIDNADIHASDNADRRPVTLLTDLCYNANRHDSDNADRNESHNVGRHDTADR